MPIITSTEPRESLLALTGSHKPDIKEPRVDGRDGATGHTVRETKVPQTVQDTRALKERVQTVDADTREGYATGPENETTLSTIQSILIFRSPGVAETGIFGTLLPIIAIARTIIIADCVLAVMTPKSNNSSITLMLPLFIVK